MQLALCNKALEHLPLEAFFELAAEAGFELVELAPETLRTSLIEPDYSLRVQILQVARAHGLRIIGFNSIFAHTPDLALVTRDRAQRERSSQMLVALIELTAEWCGPIMVIGSPRQRRRPNGATFDEAADLFIEGLRAACDRAAERDVAVCLEPLVAELTDFMNDTEEAIAIIQRMNHPALRLVLDVKQMAREGPSFGALIERGAPWLGHFHANDANREAPGEGETDFRPILRRLRAAGYDGIVSIEAFAFRGDPAQILRRSHDYLAECLQAL
jgi:sugar phosphate isomerase/epimerase